MSHMANQLDDSDTAASLTVGPGALDGLIGTSLRRSGPSGPRLSGCSDRAEPPPAAAYPDSRGDRHRKGPPGPGDPRGERAPERPVRGRELRRDPRGPPGGRAVRLRARRLHRRPTSKRGLFQMAHGGTLFLDEIGALPISLQAKLLTAVDERAVRRLGGTAQRAGRFLDHRRDERPTADRGPSAAIPRRPLPSDRGDDTHDAPAP